VNWFTPFSDFWGICAKGRRPIERRPRCQRWNDTVGTTVALQAEQANWLGLPENQQDSALAVALRAIVELDLSELQAIVPPRGFGRN
jgi:hypothetical protein